MDSPLESDPSSLLHTLKGKEAFLPNLGSILKEYPTAVHPEVKQLKDDVEKRLDASKQTVLRNSVQPGGLMHRTIDYEYAPTFISETDSMEFSDLSSDFQRSQDFRDETIAFCQQSLGLSSPIEAPIQSSNPIITNFQDFGNELRQNCSYDQRRWLIDEIEHFVRMVEIEQRCNLSERLPSIDEYKHRRMGTSAVAVCLILTDYAYGVKLPRWIILDVEFRRLADAVNIIISTTNDILSVEKEISAGQVDTLIPLLFCEQGFKLQSAIDAATDIIQKAVVELNESSGRLLTVTAADKSMYAMLKQYIEGCRFACTGNFSWSITSGRYMLEFGPSGDAKIVL
ncbi:MAG: hypothetical protein M1820_009934 [Bogoriella megaspora]|nr:MAG: hypothetical protein M1820_009934 [Bogoriella megaspora]